MYETDKDIVSALKTATSLPVLYELFCDSSTPKPCITFHISNDRQYLTGDTLGYSNVSYYIKLWVDNMAPQTTMKQLIDTTMRGMGFKRISYNELSINTQVCYIWLYEGMAKEEFN